MSIKPLARTEAILIQEFKNEVLIYDLIENKVFALNQTSAQVWNCCNGEKSVEEISVIQQIPLEIVLLAVEQLSKENLLSKKIATDLPKDKLSRRKLLRKIGTTAVVLPFISVVVAPLAVHAQSSCLPPNQPFCASPQPDVPSCTAALNLLAMTVCCSGTRLGLIFDNADGSCCSTCFSIAPPPPPV